MHVCHIPMVVAAACVFHNMWRCRAKILMTLGYRKLCILVAIPSTLPLVPAEMELVRGQSKLEMLLYIIFLLSSSNEVCILSC